ncbi:MAG: hypothetical protein JWO87_1779 [Phycisphaerales bacterium]|jgi:hypothetical protein|nr:hypothetical protein [Phycisphaerales bacterium]
MPMIWNHFRHLTATEDKTMTLFAPRRGKSTAFAAAAVRVLASDSATGHIGPRLLKRHARAVHLGQLCVDA